MPLDGGGKERSDGKPTAREPDCQHRRWTRIRRDGHGRPHESGRALVERAAEIGLAENVAALYRDDPLEAEGAVRDMVFGMARSVLADAFAALDDHGPSLQVDGRAYRKAEVTPGHAMTMFGPVDFLRSRYRPSGHGASLVPAEAVLGLTSLA